jgi:hypothetical protein
VTDAQFASTLGFFRQEQDRQFTTTATVTRPTGEPVFDPVTETFTQTFTTVYSGRCKIRPEANRSSDDSQAGETLIGEPDFNGKFPVDSDVQRDDIVTVTASTYDPGMVDRRYTVRQAQNDEWQISRVAMLEETLVPLLNGGS